jgi:multidrug efflux pump subunit AcrA (membrane-fusion protein)
VKVRVDNRTEVAVRSFVMFAALAAGCASTSGGARPEPPAPLSIQTAVVRAEPFTTLHRATATVRGRNTATLTSKTTGYLRRVFVRPGDRVRAGALLAVLESRELEAAVRRARAALAEAEQASAEAASAVQAAAAQLSMAR